LRLVAGRNKALIEGLRDPADELEEIL